MKFGKFAKAFAPLAAVALAGALSGCDGANVTFNGDKGKKLAELDLTGKAPSELALMGPDEVRITQGDKLAITVEGDPEATEQLRFTLDGDTLGVLREGKWTGSSSKIAIINVTMPAPREISMLGSGRIIGDSVAREAEINIAGSGEVETRSVSADRLEVSIAGSGSYRAAGMVKKLTINIAGSGGAALNGLKADEAEVSVAGSGDTAFASDGKVEANIMGSGSVRVQGRATCTVNAVGSGKLICEAATAAEGGASPTSPTQPTPQAK